ncbi:MAG: hypothetical protein ACK42E_05315, partial [Candidatus Bipolaricaulaceae bacterium]
MSGKNRSWQPAVPLMGVVLGLIVAVFGLAQEKRFYVLSHPQEVRTPPSEVGRFPQALVELEIRGVGRFFVDPKEVERNRPDIFQPRHLSVFDLVVHLAKQGVIDLVYHYDSFMMTHVIESLNG